MYVVKIYSTTRTLDLALVQSGYSASNKKVFTLITIDINAYLFHCTFDNPNCVDMLAYSIHTWLNIPKCVYNFKVHASYGFKQHPLITFLYICHTQQLQSKNTQFLPRLRAIAKWTSSNWPRQNIQIEADQTPIE